jgi:hypothetical protein
MDQRAHQVRTREVAPPTQPKGRHDMRLSRSNKSCGRRLLPAHCVQAASYRRVGKQRAMSGSGLLQLELSCMSYIRPHRASFAQGEENGRGAKLLRVRRTNKETSMNVGALAGSMKSPRWTKIGTSVLVFGPDLHEPGSCRNVAVACRSCIDHMAGDSMHHVIGVQRLERRGWTRPSHSVATSWGPKCVRHVL